MAGGEPQHVGVEVHEVADQLDGHPVVVEQDPHRARFAVVQGAHAVEQVGRHGGARVHGRPDLLGHRVGVSDRGDHPVRLSAVTASMPRRVPGRG